jgi:D-arabinose 1-dehydrogenase-like Zn-dependent alcohol dehydrogenase
MTTTYDSKRKHGRTGDVGFDYTLGGYSNKHVVDERFVVKVP